MLILGLESSCDETAAALVDGQGRVLASEVSSQVPIHARYGGVVPELASRNHLMAMLPLVDLALQKAGRRLDEVDRVAITNGPGLMGALLMGVQAAKTLCLTTGKELVPIHHVEAHITAVFLADGDDSGTAPDFPFMALAVSGGHSSIYEVRAIGDYRRMGSTLDDAAGEAFDKVARLLGLPYPGGLHIDRAAKVGNPQAFAFPRALRRKDNFSFSFSGLKTAVRNQLTQLGTPDDATRADLAASFQEAVVDSLVEKTLAAARYCGHKDIVVAGGVAANSRLRAKFAAACQEAGLRLHLTAFKYCGDNAAMIAGLGRFKAPLPRQQLASLEPFASGEIGAAFVPPVDP
jgi:N6-L-threonylcarbamoyladenine synthase